MSSTNPHDYTNEQLRSEIERGGRLVYFPYCISLLVITLRRHSSPELIPAGSGSFMKALPWALISLFLGWWGFPWGLIYTPVALWQALSGGVDITDEWRNNYDDAIRAERDARLAALQQQQQQQRPGQALPPALPVHSAAHSATPPPQPTSFRPDPSSPTSFRDESQNAPVNNRPSAFVTLLKVGFVLGALAFVAYLGLGYWAMHASRKVTLVNGLGIPYQVTLNGTSYDCPAGSDDSDAFAHIEVPSGHYEVRASLPNAQQFQATADIGPVSIWNWMGAVDHRIIINADQLAVIFRETLTYRERSSTRKNDDEKTTAPREFFFNQGVINIRTPDYYFVDAPSTLYIKNNAKSTRTHVEVISDLTVPQAIHVVRKYGSAQDTAAYAARASLLHGNVGMGTLMGIIEDMSPEDARKIFEKELDARPINIQWHRYYQQYAQVKLPDIDLVADYRARLSADPKNGALNYLLARILADPAESRALYEKAIAATEEPCLFAYNGLAYESLRDADYTLALDYFEKAAAVDPQSRHNAEYLNLLVSLNRADDALAIANQWFRESPADLGLASNNMLYLGLCKRPPSETTRALLAYASAASKKMSKDELANNRLYLEAINTYGAGDEKRYAEKISKLSALEGWGGLALTHALVTGDHAAAVKYLAAHENITGTSWLLGSIVAYSNNDNALGADSFAKAIDAFRKGGRESSALADILAAAGETAPAIDTVLAHTPVPDERRVVFCALGFRYPAQRDAYWREARKANFSPAHPHLLLRRVMSQ